jgi:hypothetical protein
VPAYQIAPPDRSHQLHHSARISHGVSAGGKPEDRRTGAPPVNASTPGRRRISPDTGTKQQNRSEWPSYKTGSVSFCPVFLFSAGFFLLFFFLFVFMFFSSYYLYFHLNRIKSSNFK